METTLEERVEALEEKVEKILAQGGPMAPKKDWRSTIGMFANDPVMKEIQTEGQKLRKADREQARRDYS